MQTTSDIINNAEKARIVNSCNLPYLSMVERAAPSRMRGSRYALTLWAAPLVRPRNTEAGALDAAIIAATGK